MFKAAWTAMSMSIIKNNWGSNPGRKTLERSRAGEFVDTARRSARRFEGHASHLFFL
jgi:hypothetical protein